MKEELLKQIRSVNLLTSTLTINKLLERLELLDMNDPDTIDILNEARRKDII